MKPQAKNMWQEIFGGGKSRLMGSCWGSNQLLKLFFISIKPNFSRLALFLSNLFPESFQCEGKEGRRFTSSHLGWLLGPPTWSGHCEGKWEERESYENEITLKNAHLQKKGERKIPGDKKERQRARQIVGQWRQWDRERSNRDRKMKRGNKTERRDKNCIE